MSYPLALGTGRCRCVHESRQPQRTQNLHFAMPWITRRQEWISTPRKEEPEDLDWRLVKRSMPRKDPFAFGSDLSPERRVTSPFLTSERSNNESDAASPKDDLGSDNVFSSLCAPFSKLSLVTKTLLAAQPRLEVAAEPRELMVNAECDPSSSVVAELQPLRRLRVLVSQKLDDGTVRACIVLEGSTTPLGWVTSMSADGVPHIYLYSRPLYEVCTAPKVRLSYDPTSRFVKQLPVGLKLHVVEARRTAEGALRVCIVPVGQTEPLGWITAKKPDGSRTIREMDLGDGVDLRNARPGSFGKGRPSHDQEEPNDAPAAPSSSGRQPSRKPASARQVQEHASEESKQRRSQTATRRPTSSPVVSAATIAARKARLTAKTGGGASSRKASGDSFKKDSQLAESNSAAKRAQKNAVATRAAELAADEFLAAREAGLNYVSAKELKEIAASFLERAEKEELTSTHEGKKIAARLGQALAEKSVNVRDILREWDPNGDGSISRMEFRVDVRKMLGNNVDAQETDALFRELDSDNSGAIDLEELKVALTQLKEAAVEASKSHAAKISAANDHRQRAHHAQEVAEATETVEQLADELHMLKNNNTIEAQFFRAMQKKSLKMGGSSADVLAKFNSTGDEEINLKEFKRSVLSMGATASSQELTELFNSLDSDGGGTLDKSEVNKWLTETLEKAEETKVSVQRLALNLVGALKAMKTAQAGWKKLIRAEDEANAKEAERRAAEEAVRMANEAKEAAAKQRAAEAKKAAAEAEKAAFEARIAAKRNEASLRDGNEGLRQRRDSFSIPKTPPFD